MGFDRESEFDWKAEEHGPQDGKLIIELTASKQSPDELVIISLQKKIGL